MLPFIRAAVFLSFTALTILGIASFSEEEKFLNPEGAFQPVGNPYLTLLYQIERCLQLAACAFLGLRVVQVPWGDPHGPRPSILSAYLWRPHEAMMALVAASIFSSGVAETLYNSTLFLTIYQDESLPHDARFHLTLEWIIILVRAGVALVATASLAMNIPAWKFKNPRTVLASAVAAVVTAPSALYLSLSVAHAFLVHPDERSGPMHRNMWMEFVVTSTTHVVLGVASTLLPWAVPRGNRARMASTPLFRALVGLYAAVASARMAHTVHGGAQPLMYLYPLVTWGPALLLARGPRPKVPTHLPISIVWKVGVALGVVAPVVALLAMQSQWFSMEASAGSVPVATAEVVETIEASIERAGEKAFKVVKMLDPCRWQQRDASDALDDRVQYEYPEEYGINRPSVPSFSIRDTDIENVECSCADGQPCACSYINQISGRVRGLRNDQLNIALSTNITRVHDAMDGWQDLQPEEKYEEALKTCHTKMCDAVLGIAIASEAAILASGTLWFIPGADLAIDAVAWFAQMANRVGHLVVKFGRRLARYLVGLSRKLRRLRPLFLKLRRFAKSSFTTSYKASWQLVILYLPLLTHGAFCFLVAFWKRRNAHRVIGTLVSYYVPVLVVHVAMIFLMSFFPRIVQDGLALLPSELMVVHAEQHAGFFLLRTCYIVSSISVGLMIVAALLDDAYALRARALRIRSALRHLICCRGRCRRSGRGHYVQTHASVHPEDGIIEDAEYSGGDGSKEAWVQALVISLPVLALAFIAWKEDLRFLELRYGPDGEMLGLVDSLHTHTDLRSSVDETHEFVDENSLCGLVGLAVQKALKFAVREIQVVFEDLLADISQFTESVTHIAALISSFEELGKKAADVGGDVWHLMEKVLLLGAPLISTVLMGVPLFTRDKELRAAIKQVVIVGVYYNVVLLVMMQQLFGTLESLKVDLFYYEFRAGPLMYVALSASALNAMSVFSLYVDSIYQL